MQALWPFLQGKHTMWNIVVFGVGDEELLAQSLVAVALLGRFWGRESLKRREIGFGLTIRRHRRAIAAARERRLSVVKTLFACLSCRVNSIAGGKKGFDNWGFCGRIWSSPMLLGASFFDRNS